MKYKKNGLWHDHEIITYRSGSHNTSRKMLAKIYHMHKTAKKSRTEGLRYQVATKENKF